MYVCIYIHVYIIIIIVIIIICQHISKNSNKFKIDNLESLDLSYNPMDDIGVIKLWERIWPLEVPTNHHLYGQLLMLQTLSLQNTGFADHAMHYLVQTLRLGKLPHLSDLNLSTNR